LFSINKPNFKNENFKIIFFLKDLADYVSITKDDVKPLFTDKTRAIVWGMQNKAVQAMLDFDHVCSRKQPSVVAMIYPFT
jgi:hypothetical protein